MQIVGTNVGDGVVFRSGVTGEDFFEVGWLVVEDFLEREALVFLVGDPPESFFGQAADQMAFLGVDDGVHVIVAKFIERIVYLRERSGEYQISCHSTYVRCHKLYIPRLPWETSFPKH